MPVLTVPEPEPPPLTQVPAIAKQPLAILIPPVVENDEVAVVKLMPPVFPMESSEPGVVVPIPTLPSVLTVKLLLPIVKAPAMVDVAFVVVAAKIPKVGVDVPISTPLALVETRELGATFEAVMFPETVRVVNVPTEVRDDAVTPEASVAPDRVPAAAVTVISAEPLKATPLMFLDVVRVAAEPVVF